MKTLKWILIAMVLMVFAYGVIHAIISFIWAMYIGMIAFVAVLIILTYLRIRSWFRKNNGKNLN